jgi:hypothetical protein
MQTLSFNTGREYTSKGQRIAATQLEGGEIVILDIDRHIDVMLPAGLEFTQADIMLAYDRNWHTFPNEIGMSYGDYYALIEKLREIAESI